MKVKANAKINLGLYITGLDQNNYHLLDATMLPISLYDDIEISFSDKDEVTFINQTVPTNNTVTKALFLMKKHYKYQESFRVIINKNIPSGAGLGGGSSDAAFVMKAIVELLNIKTSNEELHNIALKIGADVPFFLINKPCRMQGIGELLTPFEINKEYKFLLIKPNFAIDTVKAYKKYDEIKISKKSNIQNIINSLKEGKLINEVGNDLFIPAKELENELAFLEENLKEFNPYLLTMSGSGSTLIIYDEISKLKKIKNALKSSKFELLQIVNIL